MCVCLDSACLFIQRVHFASKIHILDILSENKEWLLTRLFRQSSWKLFFLPLRVFWTSERNSPWEVQHNSNPQILLLPMERSFGRQWKASEFPQHPAATGPTKTTACQLQVLQQVTQRPLPPSTARVNQTSSNLETWLKPIFLKIIPKMTSPTHSSSSFASASLHVSTAWNRIPSLAYWECDSEMAIFISVPWQMIHRGGGGCLRGFSWPYKTYHT